MKLITSPVSSEVSKSELVQKPNKAPRSKRLIVDIFSIALVSLVGYGLVFNLTQSPFFFTGYADWLIQAFRVRFITEFGLSSWTHIWSNGISLWRSYQFIPHALTAILADVLHIEITRAMVILTLFQFVLLRIMIYTIARSLKFSPLAGLIAVILSYDLGQYWGGVDDYSILFGFTMFPVFVWLWIKYTSGKVQFLFPYLIGLSFYVHPLLGIYAFGMWLIGLLFKSLYRPSFKLFVFQAAVIIASSSLFWIQHFSGFIKNYSSTYFTSVSFFRQTLSSFYAYGLSISVLIGLVLLWLTLPVTKDHKWAKALAVYSTLCFLAVFVSLNIQLPEAIAETQFSRGMTFVGIAIIIGMMPLLNRLVQIKVTAMRYILAVFIALTIIESVYISSSQAPHVGTFIEDPVSALAIKYPQKNIQKSRVWTPYLDSANYKAALSMQYPVSYMTHSDSNQVSVRFSDLLLYNSFQDKVPATAVTRVKEYMRITSTQYIIFEKSSPFTRTLIADPDQDLEDLGELEMKRSIYHVFALKNLTQSAVNIDPKLKKQLVQFPTSLNPANPQDQNTLDDYVSNWASIIDDTRNQKLAINYTTQDSIDISIPKDHVSSTVYIPESYSPNWQAWFNGHKATVSPVGPNFMRVEFTDTASYGLLTLKHDWSASWYGSVIVIIVLPIIYLLIKSFNFILSRVK